jgi:hypothetical protein
MWYPKSCSSDPAPPSKIWKIIILMHAAKKLKKKKLLSVLQRGITSISCFIYRRQGSPITWPEDMNRKTRSILTSYPSKRKVYKHSKEERRLRQLKIWWFRCGPVFMGRRTRRWKAVAWFFVTSLGALFYSIKCIGATSDSLYSGDHNRGHGDEAKSFITNADSGTCSRTSKQKSVFSSVYIQSYSVTVVGHSGEFLLLWNVPRVVCSRLYMFYI